MPIQASVGKYRNGTVQCYNLPSDQLRVGNLLDLIDLTQGGTDGSLLLDAKQLREKVVDERLYAAIQQFQKAQLGSSDGHVDPGEATIRRLEQIAFVVPPPPVVPPAKADIRVVAAEIKRDLANDDDRDLEFLARLFEDDRIIDSGSGSELAQRLTTILAASSDGSNGGVTHFAGIYTGNTDLGFRKAFKDPFPGKSDNQVGHFTTAVDMGFRPLQTFSVLPKRIRDFVDDGTPTAFPKEEIICVRLIIGHEQVADDATQALIRQAASPTNAEIRQFFNALVNVGPGPSQDISRSRTALFGIRIGTGVGNSFQDLHLSLFGFKFGSMIRQGTITSRDAAALWIRTNIGTLIPDPIPPQPGTLTG